MTEVLLYSLILIIGLSMMACYSRTGDALHPVMFLGPMLLYMYVLRPGVLLSGQNMQLWLNPEQIGFAQLLFTSGIAVFCVGIVAFTPNQLARVRFEVTSRMQSRLVNLACALGMLALAAYWYGIFCSGGFFSVYSQAKGNFSAGSGWINELVNLSIPSAALLLLLWQGKRENQQYILLAIFFASPLLIHGLLGARRGPTFVVLATLLVAWYITRKKQISIWKLTTRLGVIGLLVLFLLANRNEIYLGSEFDVSLEEFWSEVVPQEAGPADDVVFMYAFVNGIESNDHHFWGWRYFTTFVVRPIPSQFWPTKYDDLGLGWITSAGALAGIAPHQWEATLGWVPATGSASGFVADLFLEFSWWGLMGCFALGAFYACLWRSAASKGGLWTIIYIQAIALSVYVPTQSISAMVVRFLLMTVPTVVLWHFYIRLPLQADRRTAADARHLQSIAPARSMSN